MVDKEVFNQSMVPNFQALLQSFQKQQTALSDKVKEVADNPSQATPGKFLLLQFQMSQVTQIGESISNVISQIMAIINMSIRNQKSN